MLFNLHIKFQWKRTGSLLNEWSIEDFARALYNGDINNYKSLHDEVLQYFSGYNETNIDYNFSNEIELLEQLEERDDHSSVDNMCRKLNNWLYVMKKENAYVFMAAKRILVLLGRVTNDITDKYHCSFDWFTNEEEFENLIKLYNFNEHIDSTKDKINETITEKYNYFCHYVRSCIETYNKYKKSHCNGSNKNQSTLCSELKNFEENYKTYILKSDELKEKFPPLESVTHGSQVNCASTRERDYNKKITLTKYKNVGCYLKSTLHNNGDIPLSPDGEGTDIRVIVFESYHVFDNLYIYKKNESSSKHTPGMRAFTQICNNAKTFISNWDDDSRNLCEHFILFFMALRTDMFGTGNIGCNYGEFLNFWLSKKLRGMTKPDEFREQFYEYMNSNRGKFDEDDILSGILNDISLEDLNKLDVLYNLYDNYNKIEHEIIDERQRKTQCREYGNKCVEILRKAINQYDEEDKNKEFFNALKEFSHLYSNGIYNSESCKYVKLPQLPKFKSFASTNQGITHDGEAKSCENMLKSLEAIDHEKIDKFHNILKSFNVLDKYEKFNSVEYSDYKKYCKDICNLEAHFPGVRELCAKVSKNLEDIALESKKDERNEYCENFYYWLSDNIWNLFRKNLEYIEKKPDVLKFLKVVYDIIYRLNITECLFHYNPYERKEVLKEKKHLYYYFRYYNTIKGFIDSNNEVENKEDYCKYINYIIDLYEKHLPKCCSCFSGIENCSEYCKEYFKCSKDYYPGDLISLLRCEYEEPVKNVEELFKHVTVSRNDLILVSKELASPSVKLEHKDPFYSIVLFVFSVLGIFFAFFVFYKFTPFGTWLHKNKIREKNIRYNMQEEYMERLSERRRESDNFKSKSKRIQIAYQNN
ncbi:variable surface protein [Plasmodium gonderi]|uniref:Variable surface protein n=1 Tax=Plasmodium gonderi TaxID=77519 RepID=A0A1Y1JDU9_PLAGO|nr:variable surface protein [Plasmodium gonderi]GAW80430.1 variable surface protein [Plasmodium gonderi]